MKYNSEKRNYSKNKEIHKLKNKNNLNYLLKKGSFFNHQINNNIFLIIILFIIYFPISSSEDLSKKKYQITIQVDGEIGETANILGDTSIPSNVIINGKEKKPETYFTLEDNKNTIILIWNSLPKCSKMFNYVSKIKSIDLSNFDSSEVTDMSEMFSGNSKLESITFGNFVTSKVTDMNKMFNNCKKLISLDLTSFNTSSVKNMKEMFCNLCSLVSLDLSNFDTSSVTEMNEMFNGANSLIYLNLISFVERDDVTINNIFYFDIKELNYCINETNAPKIYEELLKKRIRNNCGNECFKNAKKIIIEEKKCVQKCTDDDKYIYELNNICYEFKQDENTDGLENTESPKNSESTEYNSENTENTENLETDNSENTYNTENPKNSETLWSENIGSTEAYPKNSEISQSSDSKDKTSETDNETIETTEDKDNFSSLNFFKESKDNSKEESPNKDQIIQSIQNDIVNRNLVELLSDLINGTKTDLIVEYKDISYQLTTTENQKNFTNNNISTIDLGDCENTLRSIYDINENLSLIILKIDYYMTGLLIPVIGYEVYHPTNFSQLNLNYCNNSTVKLNIPVSIDEDNLYLYEPNSDFYNDECYAYTTENGTDIILNDRKNEYVENNLSLCEDNCTYKGYNSGNKKALCECETKIKIELISNILNDDTILSNNFNTTKNSITNIATLKCVSLLFSKNGLISNIGSYILLFTIAFFAIATIIFYKCGYQLIESKINEIKNEKLGKKHVDIFNLDNNLRGSKNSIKKKKKKKKKSKTNISNPKKKHSKKNSEIGNHFLASISKTEHKNTSIKIYSIKHIDKIAKNNNRKILRNPLIKYKDSELNYLLYKEAILYDKRTFGEYYCNLNRIKILFLFPFYPFDDYNIKIIKICIFLLSFILYFAINTFFFNDSTLHQIYLDGGKYNFSYFLPNIIFSFILSYFIIILLKYFFLSERNILEINNMKVRDEINDKADSIKRCLMIKYIIFFISSFILLIVFWYYLSSFCAVYKNTQVYIIINTFISILIGSIYPFLFNIIPGVFRIYSLKNVDNERLFKLSKFLQEI